VHYRIGILGGSFDPIHRAHLKAAEIARESLLLDQVYLIPAGNPYHRDQVVATPQQRLAMCELAAQEQDWLHVSSIDIDRPGSTYTIDMIDELSREFTQQHSNDSVQWFLILGADAYKNFPQWKQPDEIAQKVKIVVVARPGEKHVELDQFPCDFIDLLGWEISSTGIRLNIEHGESIAELVNASVYDYIKTNKLYANQ
jgi:nicotinate-nucleotide adenylyltransferase